MNDPASECLQQIRRSSVAADCRRAADARRATVSGSSAEASADPLCCRASARAGAPTTAAKNKLFFFFSYEGLREQTNNTTTRTSRPNEYQQLVRAQRPNTVTARISGRIRTRPRIVKHLPADCSVFGTAAAARCRRVPGRPGSRFADGCRRPIRRLRKQAVASTVSRTFIFAQLASAQPGAR